SGSRTSQLRLLVHPAVGAVDPAAVRDAFLTGVSQGTGGQRLMGLVWRDSDVLSVERRAPLVTAAGKILHLHVARGQPAAEVGRNSPNPSRRESRRRDAVVWTAFRRNSLSVILSFVQVDRATSRTSSHVSRITRGETRDDLPCNQGGRCSG